MKKIIIIPVMALLCSISGTALAQSNGGQAVPAPLDAHVRPNMPSSVASPSTMPGGLYRLGNGYLNCPGTVTVTNGQPNLRSCTYIKDVH
jgi:hypothetical protein